MCDGTFCVSVRFWRAISTHQAAWDLVRPSQERSEVTAAHCCHLSCRNCSASPVSSPPCLHTCAMTQVGHMPLMDCALCFTVCKKRMNATFKVVKEMMQCIICMCAWGKKITHSTLCLIVYGDSRWSPCLFWVVSLSLFVNCVFVLRC